MRTIKFRGKRIDTGEWVFGDLMQHPSLGCTTIHEHGEELYQHEGVYLGTDVDPETISQFTGLVDKNGKGIWEYDVCTFLNPYNKESYKRIIRYCNLFACFGLYEDMEGIYNYESDWLKIREITVIGNIHDNKELI